MALIKTNRDLDSTLIVCGIHALIGVVLYMDFRGGTDSDLTSVINNLLIIYASICTYFFKNRAQANASENNRLNDSDVLEEKHE